MRILVKRAAFALSALGLFMATAGICLAHEDRDRVIPIHADGTLTELPAAYLPARIDIHFSHAANGERPVDAFRIRIGSHETSLPACVTDLLTTHDMHHIQALGSTINDPDFTSLRLNFYGPDFSRKTIFNNYVTLEFSLRSAKLIAVIRHEVGPAVFQTLVATRDKQGRTTVKPGGPKIKVGKSLSYDFVDMTVLCPHEHLDRFVDHGYTLH